MLETRLCFIQLFTINHKHNFQISRLLLFSLVLTFYTP